MPEAVIVSAVRTAIARSPGALQAMPVEEFGAAALREVLRRAGVEPGEVEDVVWGNVMAGGGNVGRLTALEAGLPVEVPALTVDRQCGSGLQAICLASDQVRLGQDGILLAGGSESMTRAPYLLERPAAPFARTPPRFLRPRLAPDAVGNPAMGETAENVAERYKVSREEQDAFALRSHRLAVQAIAAGRFEQEIVPVAVPLGKGQTAVFAQDEQPRPDTTLERLLALPPTFRRGGTVTAGNPRASTTGPRLPS